MQRVKREHLKFYLRKKLFILHYLFAKEGTITNTMYPVNATIRKRVGNACMDEHTARIRFDPYATGCVLID